MLLLKEVQATPHTIANRQNLIHPFLCRIRGRRQPGEFSLDARQFGLQIPERFFDLQALRIKAFDGQYQLGLLTLDLVDLDIRRITGSFNFCDAVRVVLVLRRRSAQRARLVPREGKNESCFFDRLQSLDVRLVDAFKLFEPTKVDLDFGAALLPVIHQASEAIFRCQLFADRFLCRLGLTLCLCPALLQVLALISQAIAVRKIRREFIRYVAKQLIEHFNFCTGRSFERFPINYLHHGAVILACHEELENAAFRRRRNDLSRLHRRGFALDGGFVDKTKTRQVTET